MNPKLSREARRNGFKIPGIADEVSEITGLSPKKTRQVIRAMLKAMAQALRNRENIVIHNFGEFKLQSIPARMFQGNPYPECVFVRFRPTRSFRAYINDHSEP